MKRKVFAIAIAMLLLAALPALAQGNYSETLSVTNSPTNIVVHSNTSFVVIRENSATPTAVFSVTPSGSGSAAVNFAAGSAFVFTNGSAQWTSGTTIGTIQTTTSGPFTFIMIEGNQNVSVPGTGGMSSGGNVGINAGSNIIGKTVPADGCGTTVFNQAWILVPNANTAVASSTTCVVSMAFTNVTTTVATITVTDNQGTPVVAINAFPVQPGATVFFPMNGALFTSGIKWQSGTASAISGEIVGNQ